MSRRCIRCTGGTEEWWNYCALCGWHIASGEAPLVFRDKKGKRVAVLDLSAIPDPTSKRTA